MSSKIETRGAKPTFNYNCQVNYNDTVISFTACSVKKLAAKMNVNPNTVRKVIKGEAVRLPYKMSIEKSPIGVQVNS